MICTKTRRQALELAEEIARRNGLSSHKDIIRLEGRGRNRAVKARKEFLLTAIDVLPKMNSVKLAELMGCHHTTVLHHLGRTKRGKAIAEQRTSH